MRCFFCTACSTIVEYMVFMEFQELNQNPGQPSSGTLRFGWPLSDVVHIPSARSCRSRAP
jgi:hypothetical protein